MLINRGFVATEVLKNPTHLVKDTGLVEITGLLRGSQVRNSFTPDNLPEKGEWYWADVIAMAENAGGEQRGVQPVYIESIFGMFIFLCALVLWSDQSLQMETLWKRRNSWLLVNRLADRLMLNSAICI